MHLAAVIIVLSSFPNFPPFLPLPCAPPTLFSTNSESSRTQLILRKARASRFLSKILPGGGHDIPPGPALYTSTSGSPNVLWMYLNASFKSLIRPACIQNATRGRGDASWKGALLWAFVTSTGHVTVMYTWLSKPRAVKSLCSWGPRVGFPWPYGVHVNTYLVHPTIEATGHACLKCIQGIAPASAATTKALPPSLSIDSKTGVEDSLVLDTNATA